jgi:hypothetical protein
MIINEEVDKALELT